MVPGLSLEHLVILGVIALIVVGPKDLPLLLRKMGQWTAKLRGMAQEFRSGFDELARQAELDELKKEVDALRRTTNLHNPLAEMSDNLASVKEQLSRPLGTLETYAGISPPTPPPETKPDQPPSVTTPIVAPDLAAEAAPASGDAKHAEAAAPIATPSAAVEEERTPLASSAP